MATKQLTALDTYVLPRVNLLPPEIGEKQAERRSYVVMGAAVAGAGAAVVALYLGQAARVSSAKAELAGARTDNQRLVVERAKQQHVQDAYRAADADRALVTRVYARRVIWSAYLHNISIAIPENVWLTAFNAAVAEVPTVQTAPGVAPAVGTLTMAGKAYEYNDLAAWLETVAKLKGVANTSFTTATKVRAKKGERTLVLFSSNASLTPAAITPNKVLGSK